MNRVGYEPTLNTAFYFRGIGLVINHRYSDKLIHNFILNYNGGSKPPAMSLNRRYMVSPNETDANPIFHVGYPKTVAKQATLNRIFLVVTCSLSYLVWSARRGGGRWWAARRGGGTPTRERPRREGDGDRDARETKTRGRWRTRRGSGPRSVGDDGRMV